MLSALLMACAFSVPIGAPQRSPNQVLIDAKTIEVRKDIRNDLGVPTGVEWRTFPVGGSPENPTTLRAATFDPKTGGVGKLTEEDHLPSDVLHADGYRINTTWINGVVSTLMERLRLSHWFPVSYYVNAPSVCPDHTPFTAQIMEVLGNEAHPLAAGSVIRCAGLTLPVGERGVFSVPSEFVVVGHVQFHCEVYPTLDGKTPCGSPEYPSATCDFTSQAVHAVPGFPLAILACDHAFTTDSPFRCTGEGFRPGLIGTLKDLTGSAFTLPHWCGSSFEQLCLDNPPLKTGISYQLALRQDDGTQATSDQPIQPASFTLMRHSAEYVGARGYYTVSTNTDGWVRVFGGAPKIQLDSMAFPVTAGKPVDDGYLGLQPGLFEVYFQLSTNWSETAQDPVSQVKVDTPTINRNQDLKSTDVAAPITVTDKDGKPLTTPVDVVVSDPHGIDRQTIQTDSDGHGVAKFHFNYDLDPGDIAVAVANVPGHSIPARTATPDKIQSITFHNDTDGPVWYDVYTPATKSTKRIDLARTDPVAPGQSVTVRGDFGPSVRVAAARGTGPVPTDDSTPGLLSDMPLTGRPQPEAEVDTRFDGLRTVFVGSNSSTEEEKQPGPPTKPLVPPKPEDPPKTPTGPVIDWPVGNSDWYKKNDWGHYPGTPYVPLFPHAPDDPGLNKPPATPNLACRDVDGWFEPIQSVYQDDIDFEDKPTKQLTRLGPASYEAELDMVADKPTVITGILRTPEGWDWHAAVTIKGTTVGTDKAGVKLRVMLVQNGVRTKVYESAKVVDYLKIKGAIGAPEPYHVDVLARQGLPGSSDGEYHPFKISAGAYSLEADLVTEDEQAVGGTTVTVKGDAVATHFPPVYVVPASLLSDEERTGDPSDVKGALEAVAGEFASGMEINGKCMLPVAPNQFHCIKEPFEDFSGIKIGDWVRAHINDVDVPPSSLANFRTDAIGAKAADLAAKFGRSADNAKVFVVLPDKEFDLTVHKTDDAAAFTANQKAMFIQMGTARWPTGLHEFTHTTPFIWSAPQMEQTFHMVWHNTNQQIASGIFLWPTGSVRLQYWRIRALMDMEQGWGTAQWNTQGTYWHLLHYYESAADPLTLDIHADFLKGEIKEACILDTGYTFMSEPDSFSDEPSGYTLVLRDAGGGVPARYNIQPGYNRGDTYAMVGSFSCRVKLTPDVVGYEIIGPHGLLAKKTLSSSKPILALNGVPTITGPVPTLHAAWTASSPDNLPLKYTVLYSYDGEFWAPAAIEQDATEITFKFQGRTYAKPKVRIIATDGTRSTLLDADVTVK